MKQGYDIKAILNRLPHRYPFILVDRVLDFEPGVKIRAIKNVTINEPFFQGHFPGRPIMPGVLIIEGLVQAGALLLAESLPDIRHDQVCFTGIDRARFRASVVPGDQLVFEVEIAKQRSNVIKINANAFVDLNRVAEAKFLAIIGGEK
jgi:3-hydroxyacyl-[acyl-carrier-protein] dehydratase